MKRLLGILAVVCGLFLGVASLAAQNEEELTLRLRRDFGLGMGTQIQGDFTLIVTGPETVTSVTFLLDGESLGEVTQAPFQLPFNTDKYTPGLHTFSATATTSDGRSLATTPISRTFVTGGDASQAVLSGIVPLMVGLVVVMILVAWLSAQATKTSGGGDYTGLFGGTLCPKCGRPFALHWWGMKLVVARLDRCPHCGKWSMVNRMPTDALKAADEAFEHASATAVPTLSPEQKLKEQLDDSRFQ